MEIPASKSRATAILFVEKSLKIMDPISQRDSVAICLEHCNDTYPPTYLPLLFESDRVPRPTLASLALSLEFTGGVAFACGPSILSPQRDFGCVATVAHRRRQKKFSVHHNPSWSAETCLPYWVILRGHTYHQR